ncbi:restriction endonuclease subunit S, partial [Lacticaseibacillus paracasei]
GNIGTTNVVKSTRPIAYYVSLALIRPNDAIDVYYLNYAINGLSFQRELRRRTLSVAFPQKINKQEIGKSIVDLPSPSEQIQIGNLFVLLDNLIAATQDSIEALGQAKKALLQHLFDQSWRFKGYSDPWEKRELGEIFNVVTDYVANGSFKSLRQRVSTYSNPNFAYMIRLQDASNNWKGPWLYTDQQSYSFLAKTKLHPGDILMSNVGSVGKFFLVPDLDRPMTLAPNAVLLRSMTYSTYFLFQLLQTSSMTESINEKTTPGVQQKINKTDFKKIITNVPTLNESSMVGQMLFLLDNLIAATQSRLSSLESLKKSLLQDLFI